MRSVHSTERVPGRRENDRPTWSSQEPIRLLRTVEPSQTRFMPRVSPDQGTALALARPNHVARAACIYVGSIRTQYGWR